MTTQLDASIGITKETVYGTAVTVDHFPEFLSEKLDWKPTFVQGEGFRTGSRVARLERRVLGKNWGEGDIELEACARGFGIFLEALLGSVTSTEISAGPAYQHVFTLSATDPAPSYTIQKGIPPIGGGATLPHTFAGAVCTKGELTAGNGEIVKLSTSWNAKEVDTATAYAAPSYAADNEVFAFIHGDLTIGGTVTAPTSTALATGGTAVTNVRDFSLSIDHKMDANGFTFGGAGKQGRRPTYGMAEVKGKITAEFDTATLRDAYLNQTTLPIVMTFTTDTLLQATTYNTLQVVIPAARLEGELPQADNLVTQSIEYTVLDDGSGAPLYVVLRNLDTEP